MTHSTLSPSLATAATPNWSEQYFNVRQYSRFLCEPLVAEDCMLQSMPDASPIRWHLAHTTWFFETFILARDPDYKPFHPVYNHLFNSYYNTIGEPFPRHQRGLLSRPTVEEVWQYRQAVDDAMARWFDSDPSDEQWDTLRTGLQHEQQHQELMLTDLKHGFSVNPLGPIYRPVVSNSRDVPVGQNSTTTFVRMPT